MVATATNDATSERSRVRRTRQGSEALTGGVGVSGASALWWGSNATTAVAAAAAAAAVAATTVVVEAVAAAKQGRTGARRRTRATSVDVKPSRRRVRILFYVGTAGARETRVSARGVTCRACAHLFASTEAIATGAPSCVHASV